PRAPARAVLDAEGSARARGGAHVADPVRVRREAAREVTFTRRAFGDMDRTADAGRSPLLPVARRAPVPRDPAGRLASLDDASDGGRARSRTARRGSVLRPERLPHHEPPPARAQARRRRARRVLGPAEPPHLPALLPRARGVRAARAARA